jgi:hypothetical protein
MRSATRAVASVLGAYAGLLAVLTAFAHDIKKATGSRQADQAKA